MGESPGKLIAVAAVVVLGLAGGWQAWQERRKGGGESDVSPSAALGGLPPSHADTMGQTRGIETFVPPRAPMGGWTVYEDPAGRFTIQVPQGWQAVAERRGVVLSNGTARVTATPFAGATSASQILSLLGEQYAREWQGLQTLDQGQFMLGGGPADYMLLTGTKPSGVVSLLRLAATMRGNEGFVLIISVPTADFNQASATLQAIEGSLALAP
jgi:hypothetical protein